MLLAAVVCYVHYEIPRFTLGFARRATAHGVLLTVGLAFGATCAWLPARPLPSWLAFAAGFGLVHLPAGAILLVKRMRGSTMS
ncbi:hypothetical protein R69919_03645 [Paraburkholderia gardini]|uniref:Uncharacterized protein n=2 Tax=Paraburkholderia gardini TaxID=2823469 RepID=A0ABM8U191_9BURK|nr:hypothetical protein R54767_01573 [Paraburkholderia gardini]CAG4908980.1 hypothetical protein R69919_03645 [Paraburkholderia gardini]